MLGNIWTITDKHCEIRFKPTPNLLKEKEKLHASLFKFFPEINEHNVTTYVYNNPENGLTLSVTNKNCVLSGQIKTSEAEHKTIIKSVWPIIRKVLDITTIQRVGLRQMCLIQHEDPPALSVKLNTNFIGIPNQNFLEYHLNYTTMKDTIGHRIASSNHIFQNVDTINLNNSIQMKGLLYDIDVFENNVMLGKDMSCINDLYDKIRLIREQISEPIK